MKATNKRARYEIAIMVLVAIGLLLISAVWIWHYLSASRLESTLRIL